MMKHNWEYKKLGDVCRIEFGTRVVQKKDGGSTYDVYGGGGATFKMDRYNREDCFIVSRFAMSPKCTRYVKGKFFLNDSGLSVSTNTPDLSQNFVDSFLLANNDKIYAMGKGAAQRNLDMAAFRKMSIPIPPLSEQSRIVAELDLLTGIIDKQNAQLKELDNLAQAIFYDMFGDPIENPKRWDICHFSDICEVTSSKRVYQSEWQKTGVPFLRISDFSQLIENKSELNAELFISRDKYDELKLSNQVPNKGDILVTARGTLGSCYIIKSNDCFYFQDGMITWLKSLSPNVEPIFIVYLFKDSSFRRQIDKNQSGSTVAYLSISMLKKFTLPVPPLALQQSFAEKIQSIEKQKETIRASIADTQKLLDYTMDKYFG